LTAHLDDVVLLRIDFQEHAGDRGRNLGVHLVGTDLQQRLVDGYRVSDLLEPSGDRAFDNALAERRHRDWNRHCYSPAPSVCRFPGGGNRTFVGPCL
jgi:hypothetical protein